MNLFKSAGTEPSSLPRDPRAPQGLILFEIDDFEPLETLFGDLLALEVIEQVERRLMSRLPHGTALWRPERGRVALSIPESTEQRVTALANELKALIARQPVSSSAGAVMISLSAGCSIAEPNQINLLGPSAQRALELARASGRARTRLLPADCSVDTAEETIVKAVRAIEGRRILLHYQPVMRIGPGERIAFHECLARLPNDGGSPLRAAQFIPLLETQGHIHRLDRLVLSQAMDVLENHSNIRLSINVSAASILDPEWLAIWDRRRLGQPDLVERLIIELSGAALLKDPLASGAFIERLRAGGSALLLEGFGAGDITAQHLKSLQFDIVKLHPSVTALTGAEQDQNGALMQLIQDAEALDLMVIAHHVETPHQVRWLLDKGVSYAQGRYYGMPDNNPHFGPVTEDETPALTSSASAFEAVSASR